MTASSHAQEHEWFRKPAGAATRWYTFENRSGVRGGGATSNRGGKGHACEPFAAGETKTLCDIQDAGIIRRIWMTLSDRSPRLLRRIRIDMHWDGSARPAVSCPLGDFFGIAHGRTAAFANALFANPEGRSFNCTIPMPFRTGARITVTNESSTDVSLFFYEIDAELRGVDEHDLYFHARWRRERPTQLGRDFEILPAVRGAGRFLGTNIGVIADEIYGEGWWGEGEVKIYLDGDEAWPTLVGTGAEDYIGTGWGMGTYFHPYQGCSVADRDARTWAFYRYHVPDPVYFDRECRVTIQSMGGMPKRELLKARQRNAPIKLATVAGTLMLDDPQLSVDDERFGPDAWCNHYRCDDYCATAYFYLDRPDNDLPPLAPPHERIAALPDKQETARADT